MPVTPPILGDDVRQWGRQLNLFLTRNLGKLYFRTSDDNPSENGIFLWDDETITLSFQRKTHLDK